MENKPNQTQPKPQAETHTALARTGQPRSEKNDQDNKIVIDLINLQS
jgi:hypothetical protein